MFYPRQWKYLWNRKMIGMKPLLSVFCLLLLLLYFGGCFPGLRKFQMNAVNEGSSISTNLEFIKAQKKIIFLTSLLKRMSAPEEQYLSELLPTIYIITPTYSRPVQKAELTRLKNVFLHIPAIHWIVVEDAASPSQLVADFLASSSIPFTHLYKESPPGWKIKHDDPRWYKPRGVLQRNEGIKWLRNNFASSNVGVVYFADDDNTYSIELFTEMRYTKGVSVWPVGLAGGVMVERPSLNSKGRVNGWIVGWRPDRSFAIDMAGFAVNLGLLLQNREAYFSHKSQRGFQETDFIEKLVKREDLEPKAELCTQVLVWHTQTVDPNLKQETKLRARGQATNVKIEV